MTRGRVNNKNLLQFYKLMSKRLQFELDPDLVKWLENKNPNGYEGWKQHIELEKQMANQLLREAKEQDNA